jgi:hypothetical protein
MAGWTESVRWYTWIIAIGINLALIAVMVAWGRGPAGRPHLSLPAGLASGWGLIR